MRLTVDIFLIRKQEILLLQRTDGFWYIPGGFVEPGEDPELAVRRETKEECALLPDRVDLLRVWSYQLPTGDHAYHATFAAACEEGDVVISHEHLGWKWMAPRAYIDDYVPSATDLSNPVHASFVPQLRRNIELLSARLS